MIEFSNISTSIFCLIALLYRSSFKVIKGIIASVISSSFKKAGNRNNKLFLNLVADIYIILGVFLNIASIAFFYFIDLNIVNLFLKNYFNPLIRFIKKIIKSRSSILKSLDRF